MSIEPIKGAISYQETQSQRSAPTSATPVQKSEAIKAQIQNDAGFTDENLEDKGEMQEAVKVKRLKSAVDHANTQIKQNRTRCEFSYHEGTKRVSIKVIDEDTKQVIREIPPEETLKMVEKMWELAGILVDERR